MNNSLTLNRKLIYVCNVLFFISFLMMFLEDKVVISKHRIFQVNKPSGIVPSIYDLPFPVKTFFLFGLDI